MRRQQLPVDRPPKQHINVLVAGLCTGPKKDQPFPIADAGHELNAQQVRERKHRRGLRLRIAVNRRGLNVRGVFQQPINNGG